MGEPESEESKGSISLVDCELFTFCSLVDAARNGLGIKLEVDEHCGRCVGYRKLSPSKLVSDRQRRRFGFLSIFADQNVLCLK